MQKEDVRAKEGELKKRLKKQAYEVYDHTDVLEDDYPFDERSGYDWAVNGESLMEVLDEVAKDYPSLTSLGLVPKMDEYDKDKLLIARNEWFKKWFGE